MRGHLYFMKQMHNQVNYSTAWFLINMLDLPRLDFLTLLENT